MHNAGFRRPARFTTVVALSLAHGGILRARSMRPAWTHPGIREQGAGPMRELFRRQPKFTPATEPENADVPDNLFFKCPQCKELNYGKEFQEALKVCQNCGYHAPLSAHERLEMLLDPDSFTEWDAGLRTADPLGFVAGAAGQRGELSRQAGAGSPQDEPVRGHRLRRGAHQRPSAGGRRRRFRLHGREHGLGLRREARAGGRARGRARPAVADGLGLRRGADAGRALLADADGEDDRRPGATRAGAACPISRCWSIPATAASRRRMRRWPIS